MTRVSAADTALPTSPDSEYDDVASYATLSSSSSIITKPIYGRTHFATETGADDEMVPGDGSDKTVRQGNYDATDAEDYDDTTIPEVSSTSQRESTPEATTSAHTTDIEEDVDANGGVREVGEKPWAEADCFANTERPRITKRNKLRTTHSKATSQYVTRLARRPNRHRAKRAKHTLPPQKSVSFTAWRQESR
ncbi:hypothetical protein MRX96_011507 [Rhipicephalus microplus]